MRENKLLDLVWPHNTWWKKETEVVELKGLEYKINNEMVHQIILKNIAEDSDTYTYIKPHIKEKDGQKVIIALRESFKNYGMLQEWFLKANPTLKNLVYRDERWIFFERFSTKFQAAIDNFADCGQDKKKLNQISMMNNGHTFNVQGYYYILTS